MIEPGVYAAAGVERNRQRDEDNDEMGGGRLNSATPAKFMNPARLAAL